MQFHVTLTTIADLSMEVDAEDEDAARDIAYDRGRQFANQDHAGYDYTVSVNEAWDLRDAEVRRV